MQDQRSRSVPQDRVRTVESAVLALLLAEDWPWRPAELSQRLSLPIALIAVAEATLLADGLVVTREGALRASWAAVRVDELARWQDSINRPAHDALARHAAIPISTEG